MWRAISLLLLLLGLAGFSSVSHADSIPSTATITNKIAAVYAGDQLWVGSTTDDPVWVCNHFHLSDCSLQTQGINWSVGIYSGTFVVTYSCPSGYTPSSDQKTCSSSQSNPSTTTCTASQMASYCGSNAGHSLSFDSSYNDIVNGRTRVCDNHYPTPSGCSMDKTIGCTAARSFPSSGSWVYNGNICNVSDPTEMQNQPANSGACGPGEYYGSVNGVAGCYSGGPVPPSTAPVADSSTGKDANGNCATGYIGSINSSGSLQCYPNTQPDPNANCPSGWNKISTGQQTVCVDPNSKPGDPVPSNSNNGGSSSSGGSNSTGGNASSPSSGKGDASGSGTQDPGSCTGMPDWVCNLGGGLSGPDGSSPSSLAGSGGDISSMLDTTDFFGGGACPAPKVVVVPLYITEWNWSIDYSPFCDIVSRLRPAVIACGFLVAGAIILKR
ncbi:virulence factor TspB C-terminal domain-related protein [Aquitalea sp. ASV15]|uniref:virulence factor TspB C-terminal domain-related protein n=1 Tax=Aquitalea sp. ASV15 TaxID=2795104 RepID=UPI0018EC5E4A|nr:virulence factor TspB C-terminal domain-related protein [Aquitalea sp. ASV15]